MKEINVDFIEQTEEGLVKKNFTTKMNLVDGLDATIQSLESQIANAGKVDSVNGKQGEVILDAYAIPMNSNSPGWTIKDELDRRAFSSDVEELQEKTEPYTKPILYKGDMNDLVAMGRYYVADSATNRPGSGGWFTDVYVANIQNAGILHKYQVAYKMTGEKSVYARNQFGGNWTEWQRIDGLDKADKEYVDTKLKEKANTHHTHYAHDIIDNTTNKTQLEINKELFQSGVESNKTLVDALNSKGVSASTSDTIKTNVGKVENIQLATGNANRSDVLSGRTFSNSSNTGLTGTMTDNGSLNRTISMQNGSVNVSPGYYSGGQVKANITNLRPEYIKKGVNVGGVVGTFVIKKNYKQNMTIEEHDGYKTTTVTFPFGKIISGTVSGGGRDEESTDWCVFDVNTGKVINGGKNTWLDRVTMTKPNEIEIRTFKYNNNLKTILDLVIEVD